MMLLRSNIWVRQKIWVRQIFQECETKGEFHMLVKRMDPATFELLLSWVAPRIQKSSKRRPTATPDERLRAAFYYLATRDASSYKQTNLLQFSES